MGALTASRILERAPTRTAFVDAIRPPPQAGEVQRVCGEAVSTRTRRALAVRALTLAALLAGLAAAHAEEAFVTNQLSDDLTVVDLATSKAVATIAIGGKPAGVAVTSDGRFAYVTSPDAKALTVVDAIARKIVGRIDVGGGPLGIAVSPDGATVYVADWYAAAVRVIDASEQRVVASIAVGASPSGLGRAAAALGGPRRRQRVHR